ncbi:MAG: hypothetical protein QG604_1, partial [Candidatus Dependentiae bacterium]|nr:hypothetical protein [Candidatus Dependentiae bacterium]
MQLQHKAYTLFVLVALSLGIPFSAISGTAATESSSSISNLFATRSAKIAGVSGIGATAFAVLCLKAHKKMVAAETVNPQSMLAQKARSRFEKLRATFLAFLLTATAAGTHA